MGEKKRIFNHSYTFRNIYRSISSFAFLLRWAFQCRQRHGRRCQTGWKITFTVFARAHVFVYVFASWHWQHQERTWCCCCCNAYSLVFFSTNTTIFCGFHWMNSKERGRGERKKGSYRCFAFIRYIDEGKRRKKCLTPTFFFSAVECNWSFYYCCQLKDEEKTRTSGSVLLGKWTLLFEATMLEFFECSLSGTGEREGKKVFHCIEEKKSLALFASCRVG